MFNYVTEYETKIGYGEVPEGIDQGLQGLCVGDKRTLIIQPLLAYGEEGLDDRVSWRNVSFITACLSGAESLNFPPR